MRVDRALEGKESPWPAERIPPIMHFIARRRRDLKYLEACLYYNPGWRAYLFDDCRMQEVIEGEFPRLLKSFNRLPKVVQKSDVLRYLLIYR